MLALSFAGGQTQSSVAFDKNFCEVIGCKLKLKRHTQNSVCSD